jgi:hypothetical protein
VTIVAGLSLAIWIYLLIAHGGFWQARDTDEAAIVAPAFWPAVTAIVPARDEAEVIGRSIGSLLAQDYPGALRIILVDDGSSDGTASIARAAAHDWRSSPGAPRRPAGPASSGRSSRARAMPATRRPSCG